LTMVRTFLSLRLRRCHTRHCNEMTA
jgi:hypothetical protein